MKKWLGFLAVMIGLGYAIICNDALCRWALAKVELDEGTYPGEAFDKIKYQDHKAFEEKYLSLLEHRNQIAKVAYVFGNTDLCLEVSAKAAEMYKDSVLDTNEAYQNLVFHKAVCLDDKNQYGNARAAYADFIDRFPQNPQAVEARQRLQKLELAIH